MYSITIREKLTKVRSYKKKSPSIYFRMYLMFSYQLFSEKNVLFFRLYQNAKFSTMKKTLRESSTKTAPDGSSSTSLNAPNSKLKNMMS